MDEGKEHLVRLLPKLREREVIPARRPLTIARFDDGSYFFYFSVQLNVITSYLDYASLFDELQRAMVSKTWRKELDYVREEFISYYQSFNRERRREGMSLKLTYNQALEQELRELPTILKPDDKKQKNEAIDRMDTLISEVKNDVKKGKRVTFKLLQELRYNLKELKNQMEPQQQEAVEDITKDMHQEMTGLINLLVKVFDLLDLVRTNVLQIDDQAWTGEISRFVDKGLALLADYGIEEIPVIAQPFNTRVMEGIGTVESTEIEAELEKYDVYSTYQRGFRFTHNQELIRRAKVITVY